MDSLENRTTNVLSHRKNLRAKLIIEGAIIGIITGLIIVLNRISI